MSDEDGNQKHLEKFNGTYRDPTQKQIGYPSDSDDDDEEEGGRPQRSARRRTPSDSPPINSQNQGGNLQPGRGAGHITSVYNWRHRQGIPDNNEDESADAGVGSISLGAFRDIPIPPPTSDRQDSSRNNGGTPRRVRNSGSGSAGLNSSRQSSQRISNGQSSGGRGSGSGSAGRTPPRQRTPNPNNDSPDYGPPSSAGPQQTPSPPAVSIKLSPPRGSASPGNDFGLTRRQGPTRPSPTPGHGSEESQKPDDRQRIPDSPTPPSRRGRGGRGTQRGRRGNGDRGGGGRRQRSQAPSPPPSRPRRRRTAAERLADQLRIDGTARLRGRPSGIPDQRGNPARNTRYQTLGRSGHQYGVAGWEQEREDEREEARNERERARRARRRRGTGSGRRAGKKGKKSKN